MAHKLDLGPISGLALRVRVGDALRTTRYQRWGAATTMLQASWAGRAVPWERVRGRGVATSVVAIASSDQSVDVDRGMAVHRFLRIVSLTPAQAVALAADVVADLVASVAVHGVADFDVRNVRVGPDGRARLAGTRSVDPDAVPAVDLPAVAALLESLRAATATGPSSAPGLLDVLERAAAQARRPGGGIAAVARILDEADQHLREQARSELARLVERASGAVPAVSALPALPALPAVSALPARVGASGISWERPSRGVGAVVRSGVRRTWRWALSIAVLLAVIAVELVVLRDGLGRDVEALLRAGRSDASSAAHLDLPPVAAPAPAAAGTIVRVDVRPLARCVPGRACVVRTMILLQPQTRPYTVSWTFQVVDRCNGRSTTVPGGSVAVPSRAARIDRVSAVALPAGQALAVMALTSWPAQAASDLAYVPEPGACRR